MNTFLKYFVYLSLSVHLCIISWELIRIPFIIKPSYLESYDFSENKIRYIKYLCQQFLKVVLFYLIVSIIDLKTTEDHKEEDILVDLNKVVDDNPINKWEYICNFLVPYRAQIAVYLYVISSNLGISSSWNILNPVILILLPIIMYKILYRLYDKHKYYKIFIWPAMAGIGEALYRFLKLKKSKTSIISNDNIPFEIMRYFMNKQYEILTLKIEADFYNVGVIGLLKTVGIFIFGDVWSLFTEKEFISVLYHEIGHVMNNSIILRGVVSKSLSIFMYVTEFVMISGSKKLLKSSEMGETNKNYINNLIMLFILLNISIVPFVGMVDNLYSNIDEIQADAYSIKLGGTKNLIRALIKLTYENNAYFDSSLVFNMMYFSHPSLKRRVDIINRG